METASPPPGTLMTGINKPYVTFTWRVFIVWCCHCSHWAVNHRRINVGRGFQAEIPPLQRRKYAHSDSHNALLLWTPCEELERPVNQLRGSYIQRSSHSVTTLILIGWCYWLTHCSSSWSSADDGSFQRGARGRGQPRVGPPRPIRVQRRLPGKI